MDFYAVREGREPGIYFSWDECQKQTSRFSGAVFQKFSSYEDARMFVEETGIRPVEPVKDKFNPSSGNCFEADPNIRYFQASWENSTARGCDNTFSSIEEVEVYIKVKSMEDGEAKWKLCFPNYVKGATEHYSRGGLERNTCRAGLMAIFRALEGKPDPKAQLLIFSDNEISVKCIKAWNDEWKDENVNLTEEGDLIKKISDKMRNGRYTPILEYINSNSTDTQDNDPIAKDSDQDNQADTGWGDFEPFLSDDEDFSQMFLNKGKGEKH